MFALSDSEIQRETGISNPLRRLKLRPRSMSLTGCSARSRRVRLPPSLGEFAPEYLGGPHGPSYALPRVKVLVQSSTPHLGGSPSPQPHPELSRSELTSQ
ncbi:hypothetical protein AB1E18_006793 [Capra hircus]